MFLADTGEFGEIFPILPTLGVGGGSTVAGGGTSPGQVVVHVSSGPKTGLCQLEPPSPQASNMAAAPTQVEAVLSDQVPEQYSELLTYDMNSMSVISSL